MVTRAELRRHGVAARQPQRRKVLELILPPECTEETLRVLLAVAGREVAPAAACELLTAWLEDGSWRERWEVHRRAREAAVAASMPADELEGRVGARVLADRRSVDEVADEFGLDRTDVVAVATREAARRGMPDAELQARLGLATPARSGRRRSGARAAMGATAVGPRVSREQLEAFYAGSGRTIPYRVRQALTGGSP